MILLLESLHPDAEALLEAAGSVVRAADPLQPPENLTQVRAILTRGRGLIAADLLKRCPALQVIARAGAGLDNLDTETARAQGLEVIFAPGLNTDTVAEHTIALMLDLSRGITRSARAVSENRWSERSGYTATELYNQTLGILGYGNIGRRVAAMARAFGMHVLVGEHRGGRTREDENTPRLPLEELLPAVDILSLHLPLTPATQGIIGPGEFELMRPGALLINTARGALLDGASLRRSLQTGQLGGFAADVLEVEPPIPQDPLLSSDRVVLTPHVASLTTGTYRELCLFTARNVLCVLRGETPEAKSVYLG